MSGVALTQEEINRLLEDHGVAVEKKLSTSEEEFVKGVIAIKNKYFELVKQEINVIERRHARLEAEEILHLYNKCLKKDKEVIKND